MTNLLVATAIVLGSVALCWAASALAVGLVLLAKVVLS